MNAEIDSWTARVAPVERSKAQARATYDRLAPWYDWVEAPFERRARAAGLRLLGARPGERILEIGVGGGHTLAALARQVGPDGSLMGIDLSLRMAQVTRRRLAREDQGVQLALIQADACHLPLHDASVDAITMSFTLELMATEDIPVVLAQCRRVLRDPGRIIVVSLALGNTPSLITRLYIAAHRRWPRTIDCRPIPLHDVLVSSGFTVEGTWAGTIGGLPVTAISARR
ncbi:MAG: methyltransferase domain-containing protein [Phycicoccus sp.]|nr:methyltransferase domain-containing protein [Phycicoccus sp.]NMM33516.1 methyltransferase domain-containing protein [Phycicoccus sp.]